MDAVHGGSAVERVALHVFDDLDGPFGDPPRVVELIHVGVIQHVPRIDLPQDRAGIRRIGKVLGSMLFDVRGQGHAYFNRGEQVAGELFVPLDVQPVDVLGLNGHRLARERAHELVFQVDDGQLLHFDAGRKFGIVRGLERACTCLPYLLAPSDAKPSGVAHDPLHHIPAVLRVHVP